MHVQNYFDVSEGNRHGGRHDGNKITDKSEIMKNKYMLS